VLQPEACRRRDRVYGKAASTMRLREKASVSQAVIGVVHPATSDVVTSTIVSTIVTCSYLRG
jgi:hypothetical protein